MKRLTVGTMLILAATVLGIAQGDRGTSSIDIGGGKVTVEFGTPKLGDRNIEDMIKPGMTWRLGSNAATTMESTVELDFGGKKLGAGKYTLTARCGQDQSWTLLASAGSGAAFEFPLHFSKDSTGQDVMKITLAKAGAGADLTIAWGTHRLHASFKPAN